MSIERSKFAAISTDFPMGVFLPGDQPEEWHHGVWVFDNESAPNPRGNRGKCPAGWSVLSQCDAATQTYVPAADRVSESSRRKARRTTVPHFSWLISLYMISVVVGGGRLPCAFGLGGPVDSPKAVLTSSSDLPWAAIALILSHLS
jgi:hypothetical protein